MATGTEGPLGFHITSHPDDRILPKSQHPGRWAGTTYFLFAGLLVGPVLLVPLAWTVAISLTDGGPRNYATAVADHQVTRAVLNSFVWVALVLGVCVAGFGLAWLARRTARPVRTLLTVILALPIVSSPLAAGIAFRLLFDPSNGAAGAYLHLNVLTPSRIWSVLGSAFAWQWTGLAFLLFSVGLDRMPADLRRVADALGYGRWRRLGGVDLPALFPFAAVAFLIVLIAAARVFELVLIAAPGPAQATADVVGLRWWRSRDVLGDGPAAALAVLLFLVVGVIALGALRWLRRDWPLAPAKEPEPDRENGQRHRRTALGTAASAVIALVWLLPWAVLLATSAHSPEAAAVSGWWAGDLSLSSYGDAVMSGQFLDALADTTTRAFFATVLVVAAAVPAAYALAHKRLWRPLSGAVVGTATVLAVAPPQVIAVPLGNAFDGLSVLGPQTVLIVVHAGLGVPLAVLLLRNAFVSVPTVEVNSALIEGDRPFWAILDRSRSVVLTVAVIEFVLVWNDLVIGLLLNWPAAHQATLLILEQSRQFTSSSGVLAAQAVIVSSVPVALVLLTGRWLKTGITMGDRR